MVKKYQLLYGEIKNQALEEGYYKSYFELFNEKNRIVDDYQLYDLSVDDLFHYTNRCVSSVGEMVLYNRLRHVADMRKFGRLHKYFNGLFSKYMFC